MRPRRMIQPHVAIEANPNESAAIEACLEAIKAGEMIRHEDVVVITPNWVQQKGPETGIVVGPESLRAIIRFVRKREPRRVVVATGSAQKETPAIMKTCGYEKVILEEDAEFIDLNEGPFTAIPLSHGRVPQTKINKLFEEMTFLISFAQLKIHEEATVSAAIKNVALGWPPAAVHGFPKKDLGIHDDLHGFIRAMAEKLSIDLSIVSANPAMIGTGPGKGLPKHTGIVIAGTDPVAVDTIGARLLGFKPQAVHYLFDLGNRAVGETDIDRMYLYGMGLVEAERAFSMGAYQTAVMVDG